MSQGQLSAWEANRGRSLHYTQETSIDVMNDNTSSSGIKSRLVKGHHLTFSFRHSRLLLNFEVWHRDGRTEVLVRKVQPLGSVVLLHGMPSHYLLKAFSCDCKHSHPSDTYASSVSFVSAPAGIDVSQLLDIRKIDLYLLLLVYTLLYIGRNVLPRSWWLSSFTIKLVIE